MVRAQTSHHKRTTIIRKLQICKTISIKFNKKLTVFTCKDILTMAKSYTYIVINIYKQKLYLKM